MKKCIAGLLALVLLLAGCGAAEEQDDNRSTHKNEAAPPDVVALYTQLEAVGVPEMLEVDEDLQLDLYGIQAEDVKQSLVLVASDGLLADEIWLIEALDEGKAANIKELALGRISQKDRESVTYSPEQNSVVKKAVVEAEGNFVYLICSPYVEDMVAKVNAALGK